MRANESSNPLTPKQERTIGALLDQRTLGEAAKAAGISEATLFRYLQGEDFQTAYREARRAALLQATARLQRAAGLAVDTLKAVMGDAAAPAAARVTAARAVLDVAVKAVELEDLDARLSDLERLAGDALRPKGRRR